MKRTGCDIQTRMEEDKESGVVQRSRQMRQNYSGPTNQANKTNCSPEYIRSRRTGNRRARNLNSDSGQAELSFKNKRGRMKGKIARELFPDRKESYEECMGEGPTRMVRDAVHWSKGWLTDDEEEQLQDKNNDEDQLEGYSSEIDKGSLYKLRDAETSEDVGDWVKFDDTPRHKMVLYQGQRFRDVGEFRKAVQVFAVREGFKLCVMENRSHVVCYECSDLRCDWVIQAGRVSDGTTFIVTDFMPQHTCIRPPLKFQPQSKWISAIYLHRWKLQPKVSTVEIRDEIEATYGVVCPEGKLLSAANRAKHILGMDHYDGYAKLNQLKKEMERIDSHNIVLLETDGDENGEGKRLNKMFVCWERTSYAFKYHCRGILAVDGWKMNNPYKSVMLVAAGLDGNNGILPVAFCEVDVEDLESWVYFLKNINNALRLENGKGICILGDGDNGIDYAVEEFLPEAAYRQCCHKVFTEMVKRFPAAPVQHLFWSACRSTSEASFHKYMDLIQQQSKECHEWLLQTNWSSWALFSIPKWVKCTSVTLSITDKLHTRLRQYLEMSIARRFTGIARLTADLFERRRMAVWNWYREKVTPTVREVIHDRTIDGQRFAMVEQNGTTLKLTDTISMFYDLDMEAMSCSCGLWQISGIPCAHACRAIQLNMGNVEEYVDNMMSVQNYCSTYAPGMAQLPKEHDWKSDAGNIILPPMIHSPKAVSAKGSNEIVPNTSLQSIANYSHSATNNQQVHIVLEV